MLLAILCVNCIIPSADVPEGKLSNKNLDELNRWLELDEKKIQCVVSNTQTILPTFPLGKAQEPELWDYADGVDVMEFLVGL